MSFPLKAPGCGEGAAIFLAPGDGQLKLVTEGARGLLYVGL